VGSVSRTAPRVDEAGAQVVVLAGWFVLLARMDLPPPITQQPRVATQNRPSIGYLVFISVRPSPPVLLRSTYPAPPLARPHRATAEYAYRQSADSASLSHSQLLFYLITNSNSSSGPVPDPSTASSELGRLRSDLLRRVQRRDGLASYLGLNDTKARELPSWALPDALVFNVTVPPDGEGEGEGESEDGRVANATLYSAIPFDPAGGGNKAIVPFVQSIVENPLGASLFAQNVTGFVKGTWTMRQLSLADLGLTETHNTTAQVEHEVQGEVEEQGEGDVAASTEETGPSRVERRRLARVDDGFDAGAVWKRQAGGGGGLLGTAVNAADTVSWSNQSLPVYQTVNETVVHNRTADRGPYPWSKGGKLNFNLREERQSAWAYDSEEEGRMALLTAADGDGWAGQGPVTFLSGDMTFTSFDGQNDFVFDVEGAHFLSQGSVFGYASPQNDRRSQLFNVPGLAVVDSPAGPDSGLGSTKARAKVGAMGRMVVAQIDRRIEQDRDEIEQHRDGRFPPQGADLAGAQPGAGQFGSADVAPCIFALFGQLAPLPRNYTPDMYLEYYRSLLRPRGTSLAPPPAPRMEYTLYSENCGLVLEGEGAGLSSYRLWEQATGYATVMAVVQAMLLVLLVRQIEWGGASAGGRVAYMTIGLQAAVDSYFFVSSESPVTLSLFRPFSNTELVPSPPFAGCPLHCRSRDPEPVLAHAPRARLLRAPLVRHLWHALRLINPRLAAHPAPSYARPIAATGPGSSTSFCTGPVARRRRAHRQGRIRGGGGRGGGGCRVQRRAGRGRGAPQPALRAADCCCHRPTPRAPPSPARPRTRLRRPRGRGGGGRVRVHSARRLAPLHPRARLLILDPAGGPQRPPRLGPELARARLRRRHHGCAPGSAALRLGLCRQRPVGHPFGRAKPVGLAARALLGPPGRHAHPPGFGRGRAVVPARES